MCVSKKSELEGYSQTVSALPVSTNVNPKYLKELYRVWKWECGLVELVRDTFSEVHTQRIKPSDGYFEPRGLGSDCTRSEPCSCALITFPGGTECTCYTIMAGGNLVAVPRSVQLQPVCPSQSAVPLSPITPPSRWNKNRSLLQSLQLSIASISLNWIRPTYPTKILKFWMIEHHTRHHQYLSSAALQDGYKHSLKGCIPT